MCFGYLQIEMLCRFRQIPLLHGRLNEGYKLSSADAPIYCGSVRHERKLSITKENATRMEVSVVEQHIHPVQIGHDLMTGDRLVRLLIGKISD